MQNYQQSTPQLAMSSDPSSIQQPTPQKPKSPSTSTPTFLTLPPEIHTLIATHLPYPDLLSLTLTHPLFTRHPYIRTTKSARVDWLLSRALIQLPLPTQTRCRWSSDREFVSNPEVTAILRRRREHAECAEVWRRGRGGSGGCLVVEGGKCVGVRRAKYEYSRGKRGWIGRATGGFEGLRKARDEVRGGIFEGFVEVVKDWWMVVGVVLVAWVFYLVV